MKRFGGTVAAIVGAIGLVLLVAAILRFGATNMRRVEAESIQWKMNWMDRAR